MILKKLYKFNQYGGDPINNKMFYLIIIIIALSFIAYHYYILNNSLHTQIREIPNKNSISVVTPISSGPPSPIIPAVPVGQKLREYDYRALNDELTPPFKRDDYYVPPQLLYPREFGLYTKGAPGIFRKMGYIQNLTNTDYKFLTLMGRQKYQGSTQYEYYVTSTDKDSNIKFYLDKYKKELYDGDTVIIPQLNNQEYTVFIDKNLDFEYIPYV